MDRVKFQVRSLPGSFQVREENEEMRIEGYFAVFNSNYEMFPGAIETIAPGAFASTLGNDVRALINHDTTLVIGRNKAGTLELKEDSHGLWGSILINPKDSDAVNLYERNKRGDVDQASFGFEIVKEDTEYLEDGSIRWTIREVNLFEVSVCTFPAYEETSLSARKRDFDELMKRKNDEWKARMTARLKGEQNA